MYKCSKVTNVSYRRLHSEFFTSEFMKKNFFNNFMPVPWEILSDYFQSVVMDGSLLFVSLASQKYEENNLCIHVDLFYCWEVFFYNCHIILWGAEKERETERNFLFSYILSNFFIVSIWGKCFQFPILFREIWSIHNLCSILHFSLCVYMCVLCMIMCLWAHVCLQVHICVCAYGPCGFAFYPLFQTRTQKQYSRSWGDSSAAESSGSRGPMSGAHKGLYRSSKGSDTLFWAL